jgi:hypothetical protein
VSFSRDLGFGLRSRSRAVDFMVLVLVMESKERGNKEIEGERS